jgi:hypothetical protein
MPRIRIDDLPAMNDLTAEEMKQILGTGPRWVRPGIEPLEDRTLMSVRWTAGSGDWNTATNWSGGMLPGPADIAVIDTNGITVTHSSGSHSICTFRERLTLDGGVRRAG